MNEVQIYGLERSTPVLTETGYAASTHKIEHVSTDEGGILYLAS